MQTILNQKDLQTEIGCAEAAVRGILDNLELRAFALDPAPMVKATLRMARDFLAEAAKKQAALHPLA